MALQVVVISCACIVLIIVSINNNNTDLNASPVHTKMERYRMAFHVWTWTECRKVGEIVLCSKVLFLFCKATETE